MISSFVDFVRACVLGSIIWFFYRLMLLTWRVQIHEPPELLQLLKNKKCFVLAHFHGDEIALVQLFSRYPVATIVSTSKDGSLMNTVVRLLGGKTSRGSSTRGGISALKGLLTLMKSGWAASFAVDGPKGPLHEVKPGVFEVSKVMQAPIFCAGVACDQKWVFKKSWNQTYLPKPFARIQIYWSYPVGPLQRQEDPRDKSLALQLQTKLFEMRNLASEQLRS